MLFWQDHRRGRLGKTSRRRARQRLAKAAAVMLLEAARVAGDSMREISNENDRLSAGHYLRDRRRDVFRDAGRFNCRPSCPATSPAPRTFIPPMRLPPPLRPSCCSCSAGLWAGADGALFSRADLALHTFVEALHADDDALVAAAADASNSSRASTRNLMVRPSRPKTSAVAVTRRPIGVAATWLTSRWMPRL